MSGASRNTDELPPAQALEHALQTLQRTEAAFAQMCEELRKQRSITVEALRCANEYRRLYERARARRTANANAPARVLRSAAAAKRSMRVVRLRPDATTRR